MTTLSVIVCTHAPASESLRRVLDALAAQTLPRQDWELLLVDNASNEPLIAQWDLSWHPQGRHVREETLGLTPARLRGLEEARGDVLVFVDDDNVLEPDYLETASALLDKEAHLGAIGSGCLDPEYAVPPPRGILAHVAQLVQLGRSVGSSRWSNNPDDHGSVPWGAGLCVTRRVADDYVRLVRQMGVNELLDRRGDRLFGNGDVAFSWSAVRIGLGFGVFPQLRIRHLIPARRLTKAYMLRYVEDGSFSSGVTDYLRTGVLPGPGFGKLEALLRLSMRGLRRGPFASRIGWAAIRGAAQARAYIEARGLRPFMLNQR